MTEEKDIFSYIKEEENYFETQEIRVAENWSWNMRNHLQMSFQFIHGIFTTGENDWTRVFKKIIEPILNLRYWLEDIELRDITFYVEDENNQHLSLLLKKYHYDVYVKENDLDTFFDELAEEDIDYGGVLVQDTDKPRPEVLSLLDIAFCDQTDIMGAPIAFRHYFSPDRLLKMSSAGWGDKKNGATNTLDELIVLADYDKDTAGTTTGSVPNRTPGKQVKVYIVRGSMPEHYLLDNNKMDKYVNQIQIVAFYPTKEKNKILEKGTVLYRKKEDKSSLKFNASDKKVHGRALARGGAESLFHDQIWTNFLEIHKMNLLEAASKTPLYTDDPNYVNRNKIRDMDNLEITTIEEGKVIRQVPTAAPINVQLFERTGNELFEHAQLIASAFDPLLGERPPSGTTFSGQERIVAQGRGYHNLRRGRRAKFIEEIYKDWIIPKMVKKILNGKKFLATLSSEEMSFVSDRMAENWANRQQFEAIVDGRFPEDKESLKQRFLQEFSKGGSQRWIEILKDEFRDIEVKMSIDVAGKQKNLRGLSDDIFRIWQFIFANPDGFARIMQVPGMRKAFQDLLEFSGLSTVDFSGIQNLLTSKGATPESVATVESPAAITAGAAEAVPV